MGAQPPEDLSLALQGTKVSFSVDRMLGVIAGATKQGGETALKVVDAQQRAMEQQFGAIDNLVKKVLELSSLVAEQSAQSADLARVAAAKDVKIAEIEGGNQLITQAFGLVNSPLGAVLAAKLGVEIPGGPPTPQKQAAQRVVKWILEREDVCSKIHEGVGDDWLAFIDWSREALGK